MHLKEKISKMVTVAIANLYQKNLVDFEIQQTKKDFVGDFTLVVFPLTKALRKKPETIAEEIGNDLIKQKNIADYNVVKGFLNLSFNNSFFLNYFLESYHLSNYGFVAANKKENHAMVEYASPNTNKPIHLGHIRNLLLGFSLAEIKKAAGYQVTKTQVINDRGIHICKSMLAYQKFGKQETPESSNTKGDHLVGKYYVLFNKEYKKEVEELIKNGLTEEQAKKEAPILLEAQEMLRKWEAKEPETVKLWTKMNQWVYAGFDETFKRIGVDFDYNQYESHTYLLGKKIITEGLEKGVFYQKENGSVWCDLTQEGLDEKLVLRADGTAVYMTQDLGTATERFNKFKPNSLTYVVGNEQDYHFKVLFLILQKLGYSWADSLSHLSYGMVELPDGKMKSREGTVVDADDLMNQMQDTAKSIATELGNRLNGYTQQEKDELFEQIGLGALKYFILKVDPKKRILFNPEESVKFQGDTGPFIQYTHARIKSLLRKAEPTAIQKLDSLSINSLEKAIIIQLNDYQEVIQKSALEQSPAIVANYVYDLVKTYNQFYQNHSILQGESEEISNFRLQLSSWTANVIKSALFLLGIQAPEKM